ncbi:MAG: M1 family metallopeptidase, partial [Pseudomonadales bacterium]|nr:M1 family metallopeptidase [Pseudomonadales bacterium]
IPLGKLPADASPTHYNLHLTIDPDIDTFSGRAIVDVTLHKDLNGIWMHGNGLAIAKIWITHENGHLVLAPGSFIQKEAHGAAWLNFGAVLPAGNISIGFEYEAPFSSDLLGLHVVRADDTRYATTQFEMIAARRVFPSFDEPRFKTTFDVSITTKIEYIALTNSPEIKVAQADGWRTTSYARTPPLPTYLLAFVVGPWEVVDWEAIPATALRPTPLPLRGVTVKGNSDKIRMALEGTADIVLELERYFGVPYPFKKLDIVAVPDFAFGAMENAGLITYRDNLLLVGENSPSRQKKAYISVHAHELAHQWFGNLVTMPWWNDVWLNESFATWAGTRAANAVHPTYKFNSALQSSALGVMANDSLASVRRINEEVNNADDIQNAFDGITYQKGGAVLRMFESYLGPDKFRSAIHFHLERFPYGTATAIDFFDSVEKSTKIQGVKNAFSSFINKRGVPLVSTTLSCDEGRAVLTVNQERYLPLGSTAKREQTWILPFCYAMEVDDQLSTNCKLLEKPQEQIFLKTCPNWMIPNAKGMGYYRWSLDPDSLIKLTHAFDKLSEDEQLSYADSLGASLAAGKMDFSTYMQAIPAMIRSNNQAVVTSPIALWTWIHEKLNADAKRISANHILTHYSARLADLNSKEKLTPSDEYIQRRLTNFVTLYGNDLILRSKLAQQAIDFLQSGDNLETVQWDNMRTALIIAIEDLPTFDSSFGSIVKRIQYLFHKTQRSVVRNAMLQALGSAKNEESRTLARLMLFDTRLKLNEIPTLLGSLNRLEIPHDNWSWLTQNYERIVKRMPENKQQSLPRYASAFCSKKEAEKVADFYATRIDSLLGGKRSLAQTLESINLCAAKRDRHLDDAERYFTP